MFGKREQHGKSLGGSKRFMQFAAATGAWQSCEGKKYCGGHNFRVNLSQRANLPFAIRSNHQLTGRNLYLSLAQTCTYLLSDITRSYTRVKEPTVSWRLLSVCLWEAQMREIYILPWLQVHIMGPRHHLTSSLQTMHRGHDKT